VCFPPSPLPSLHGRSQPFFFLFLLIDGLFSHHEQDAFFLPPFRPTRMRTPFFLVNRGATALLLNSLPFEDFGRFFFLGPFFSYLPLFRRDTLFSGIFSKRALV